jgi:peptidoglycan/xylan/chitin deacetylase (PgdA/CDA1 family)
MNPRTRCPSPLVNAAAFCAVMLMVAVSAACGETVVSLTFDDGTRDQLVAREILDQRALKATFFINTGTLGTSRFYMTAGDLQSLQAAGHEIGGHTVDHLDLTKLSAADQQHQICDDRAALVGFGLEVVSFDYPFGFFNSSAQATAQGCGYLGARALGGVSCSSCPAAESLPPAAPLAIRTPGLFQAATALAEMEKTVAAAEQSGGGWVPLVMHHVCDGCASDAISPADLASFADFLLSRMGRGTSVQTVGQVIAGSAPSNPAPALSALSPSSATAGRSGLDLSVTGSGFIGGSAVMWNGQKRATTFVSGTQLRASILAADLSAATTASVNVFNPARGGGTSTAAFFFINAAPNPPPSVAALMPSSATVGCNGISLTVLGSDFISSSAVFWNGQSRSTFFVNSAQLSALIPASDLTAPTTATVTVFNPGPGGGTSTANVVVYVPAAGGPSLAPDLNSVRVFPNPWRADRHRGFDVTFDGLTAASHVRIFTISGRWIRTIAAAGGKGTWDLANDSGERVAAGVYLYLITDATGHRNHGAFAVIQ